MPASSFLHGKMIVFKSVILISFAIHISAISIIKPNPLTSYDAECVPGQHTKVDCNSCVCTDSGTLACTRKMCLDKAPESLAAGVKEDDRCHPGEQKQMDCNMCLCSPKGFFVCTKRACLDRPRPLQPHYLPFQLPAKENAKVDAFLASLRKSYPSLLKPYFAELFSRDKESDQLRMAYASYYLWVARHLVTLATHDVIKWRENNLSREDLQKIRQLQELSTAIQELKEAFDTDMTKRKQIFDYLKEKYLQNVSYDFQ